MVGVVYSIENTFCVIFCLRAGNGAAQRMVRDYEGKRNEGAFIYHRDLKKLIYPLIVEQILAVSVGMVDTVMVSSVGEAATSGVSLVDMINTLFINIFAAVATGGAVVASQYLGQKKLRRACESADQLILITGAVSVVIMALSILFRRGFLNLLYGGIAPDVMEYALIYLILSAVSYPFLAVYNSCAALFRSMGNSKISMQASIIMNIINVIGDSVLIFVFHWGVAGAAAASLVSRMTACFILLYRLKNPALDIHIGTSRRINWIMIRRILHIGVPNGIENSIFQLGRVLVVGIIAMFGTAQIAANAIANNLDGMGCIVGQAMGLAMITVVGRCVGAGDLRQAGYFAKKLLLWDYLVQGVSNGLVLFFLPQLLGMYTLSQETWQLAWLLVMIHAGSGILLWPASFVLPNALRAANDVKFTMFISIFSMMVWRLGFSYILCVQMGMGAVGVWIAMVVDWIFRVLCFVLRFATGAWKKHCTPARAA